MLTISDVSEFIAKRLGQLESVARRRLMALTDAGLIGSGDDVATPSDTAALLVASLASQSPSDAAESLLAYESANAIRLVVQAHRGLIFFEEINEVLTPGTPHPHGGVEALRPNIVAGIRALIEENPGLAGEIQIVRDGREPVAAITVDRHDGGLTRVLYGSDDLIPNEGGPVICRNIATCNLSIVSELAALLRGEVPAISGANLSTTSQTLN